MTKSKILSIAVVVLILLNIAILSFLFFSHKDPRGLHHQERGKKIADTYIKERFNFSDDQMKFFTESKERHNQKSKLLNEELSELSVAYYLALGNSILQDSLWLKISDLNKSIYKINNKHFEDVNSICSKVQKKELNNFIKNISNRKQGVGPPPKRRK